MDVGGFIEENLGGFFRNLKVFWNVWVWVGDDIVL